MAEENSIGISRLLQGSSLGTNNLQSAADSVTSKFEQIAQAASSVVSAFQTTGRSGGGNSGNTNHSFFASSWNNNSNNGRYGSNGGGGSFTGNSLGNTVNYGGPGGGPPGGNGGGGSFSGRFPASRGNRIATTFGAAAGVASALNSYANKNMNAMMQMNYFGTSSAFAAGGTAGINTAQRLAFANNYAALNVNDAAAAGYTNAYTFGNSVLGNGSANPAFVSGMSQANSFGYVSPTMGAQAAANAAQQTYSPRSFYTAQGLGIASPILPGGVKNSMGNIAQSIYTRVFGNQKITNQGFNASITQGGGLNSSLQYMGNMMGWSQATQQEYQDYIQGMVVAQNKGMSQSTYSSLLAKAVAGDKSAQGQLKGIGIGNSAFEAQRNLTSTQMTRSEDVNETMATAFTNTTNVVNQFSAALTSLMKSTGLDKLLGAGAGTVSPISRALGGFSGMFGSAAGLLGASRLFGAGGGFLGGLGGGGTAAAGAGGLSVAGTLGVGALGVGAAIGGFYGGRALAQANNPNTLSSSQARQNLFTTQHSYDLPIPHGYTQADIVNYNSFRQQQIQSMGLSSWIQQAAGWESAYFRAHPAGSGSVPGGITPAQGVPGSGTGIFGGGSTGVIGNTPGNGASNMGASAGAVIHAAETQLGIKYVWGDEAPGKGFDCCLTPETLVRTTQGPKAIIDIVSGDIVYSWAEGGITEHKVITRSEPKIQQTYTVRTNRRSITASGNHPFLRMNNVGEVPTGHGRPAFDYAPEWTPLEELNVGDILVSSERIPERCTEELKGKMLDPDFWWLLGVYTGDGTRIRENSKALIVAAFGEFGEHVREVMEKLTGYTPKFHSNHGWSVYSVEWTRLFASLGMNRLSTDREVPEIVWSLPHDLMRSYMIGYTDADGSYSKRTSNPAWQYKATSKKLVQQIREIHITLGHNVTVIKENKRTKPIIIKGKEVVNAKNLWCFEAYPYSNRKSKHILRSRRLAKLFTSKYFLPETIKSITKGTVTETYDIEVEGSHNFIAEGLVVHNSGLTQWAYSQAGVKIPRVAADQQKASKGIPTNATQPGDLLFVGNPAHHVVMSIGGGKIIEAPSTGGHVQERALNPSEFTSAGRFINTTGSLASLLNSNSTNTSTLNNSMNTSGGDLGSLIGGTSELSAVMAALSGGMGAGSLPLSAGSSSSTTTTSTVSNGNGNNSISSLQNYAKQLLASYGWAGEWGSFNSIVMSESGWNYKARNAQSGAYGIPQCVGYDTEILTKDGWKTHDQVNVGDSTIGYNPVTGKSEWTEIISVLHPGLAELVQFGISRWHGVSTRNHRWLMQEMHNDKPGKENMVRYEDNLGRKHRLVLAKESNIESCIDITVQEAALLGWIAGDGWIEKPKVSERKTPYRGRVNSYRPGTYFICQTKKQNWEHIEWSLGNSDNWSINRTCENGNRWWRLSAPYARDLTERAGNPKTDSVLQVLRMNTEQRAAWLEAITRGEGYVNSSYTQITQNDGVISDAIILAIYLSGKLPSVYTSKRTEKSCHTIGITEPFIGLRNLTETSLGEKPVWCVVTKLGTWTARRGNSVFLTGNSLPGTKMASAGSDWQTNGDTQLRWMMQYIKGRYGDPNSAWSFHQKNNYYDQGAWNISNDQTSTVHKGEMIIPAQQAETIRQTLINSTFNPNVKNNSGGSSITFGNIYVQLPQGYSGTQQEATAMTKLILDTIENNMRLKNLQAGQ